MNCLGSTADLLPANVLQKIKHKMMITNWNHHLTSNCLGKLVFTSSY